MLSSLSITNLFFCNSVLDFLDATILEKLAKEPFTRKMVFFDYPLLLGHPISHFVILFSNLPPPVIFTKKRQSMT